MLRGNDKEKGFTLIELILVIVILGILTAVALPRFINLDESARQARNQGALAAFRGTITMLHGGILINGVAASEYDQTTVINQTEISGGNAAPTGADDIRITWDDNTTYDFDYTDNTGTTTKATINCTPNANCS